MAQLLQEYVDSRGVAVGVDRKVGILRGVKLIGLESRNGRRYRESALAAAATLYEEAKVNVNHPKDGPLSPRDYQDRLGVIRHVALRAGEGLFGDLHFNPKHALAEQLLWDAEHNPHNVGFSHNVLARLSLEDKTVVVEEITKVQSVDLVADPATTDGLFEQAATAEVVAEFVAEVETESAGIQPTWDALTREVLQLHRPDLLAEIQAMEAEQLQQQLDEALTLSVLAKKKQRVYELLCENQLSVCGEQSSAELATEMTVSPSFVALLMQVADEGDLETLVVERAELARTASRKSEITPPFSRDQTLVLASQSLAPESAQDFAATLKSAGQ